MDGQDKTHAQKVLLDQLKAAGFSSAGEARLRRELEAGGDHSLPEAPPEPEYTPGIEIIERVFRNIYRFGDGQGGVGGYFSPQYPNYVFIDSSDMSWADEILAHEFQHLIHWDEDPWEDHWINEGCADFAIFSCFGASAGSVVSHTMRRRATCCSAPSSSARF